MTNNSIHRRGAEGAEGEYSGVLIHRLPRFHRFLDHRGNGDFDDHWLGGRGLCLIHKEVSQEYGG